MSLYEMTFHVEHVAESLVDQLIDEFDATVGTDHTGHEFVTVLGEGPCFDAAARATVTKLQALGLCLTRLVPDLATRSEIAARLGVTRQAVQNWTAGKRQGDFSKAINPVGGGVWSWRDVWEWATAHGHATADDVTYPTQTEVDIINAWLGSGMTVSWAFGSPRVQEMVSAESSLGQPLRSVQQLPAGGFRTIYRARQKALA